MLYSHPEKRGHVLIFFPKVLNHRPYTESMAWGHCLPAFPVA